MMKIDRILQETLERRVAGNMFRPPSPAEIERAVPGRVSPEGRGSHWEPSRFTLITARVLAACLVAALFVSAFVLKGHNYQSPLSVCITLTVMEHPEISLFASIYSDSSTAE
jgi:hypothetical protein